MSSNFSFGGSKPTGDKTFSVFSSPNANSVFGQGINPQNNNKSGFGGIAPEAGNNAGTLKDLGTNKMGNLGFNLSSLTSTLGFSFNSNNSTANGKTDTNSLKVGDTIKTQNGLGGITKNGPGSNNSFGGFNSICAGSNSSLLGLNNVKKPEEQDQEAVDDYIKDIQMNDSIVLEDNISSLSWMKTSDNN